MLLNQKYRSLCNVVTGQTLKLIEICVWPSVCLSDSDDLSQKNMFILKSEDFISFHGNA